MTPAAALASPPQPDRFEILAAQLAAEHEVGRHTRSLDLLRQLAANHRQLEVTYRSTVAAADAGRWISPAGEWLLDNFHVVREQLREAREDLPRRFYRELPLLVSGRFAGMPRAFALAVELIDLTDGHLDVDELRRFLDAYQATRPLTSGELWAIPIALRHGFLDRLAEIAARVERARKEREAAALLAAELARTAKKSAEEVPRVLERKMAQKSEPPTTMFTAELLLRLRDQDAPLAAAAAWLEGRIHQQGTTIDEAIRAEHQSQASNQVSVGNAIRSMRTITATDWAKVFEAVSRVERALARDPSGDYSRMDFATRDDYRHQVERIAKRAHLDEETVAEAALALAATEIEPRRRHVGYFVVGRGLVQLERQCHYRLSLRERVRRAFGRHATLSYLGGLALVTAVIGAVFFLWMRSLGTSVWPASALTAVALLPFSEIALSLVNLFVTIVVPPRLLPKLDFLDGIPAECRSFVVVPALLSSAEALAELLDDLEVRYFANSDPHLHFALLSDFCDAPTETTPSDDALLNAARQGIERLNAAHGADRFHLFHRRRVWCESERAFMGWERKRGKLVELNRLFRGATDTTFCLCVGDSRVQKNVRYVITLDADTRLPRDVACRMVGAMAHPLNRPVLKDGRVVDGYAILQPRISVAMESARRTRFAHIFSSADGVDPYTNAVSDVYQDLFGEGSFVGKGIYDINAVEAALRGRVPQSAVLSHDLFEGLFARAGLVSDVELFDDAPSRYLVHSARRHRWIRGDWQLLPWLRSRVPAENGDRVPNPLSAIERWKLADNLRRSLVPPAQLLVLLMGWALAPNVLSWTAAVLALIALPVFAHWSSSILVGPGRARWRSLIQRVTVEAVMQLVRASIDLLLLPHDAWVSIDAIVRANYRRVISRRRLLEWTPAAQAERRSASGPVAVARALMPSLLLSMGAGAWAIGVDGARSLYDAPLLGGWLLAPWIVFWLSRPPRQRQDVPTTVERHFLRRVARRTWRYFDELVTAVDHALPPDNFQEDPRPLVAHRTSPTNIGLSLLANVCALDLGYIGLCDCIGRVERSIDTVEKMEKLRGHLFNWYDTGNLRPLNPRYLSTVDSGNLAAALIALKQWCLTATTRDAEIFRGLTDTLLLFDESLDGDLRLRDLRKRAGELLPLMDQKAKSSATIVDRLRQLRERVQWIEKPLGEIQPPPVEAQRWARALAAQLDSQLTDLLPDNDPSERLTQLAARAGRLVAQMDFSFLYDRERQVFSIGYDVQGNRLDGSYYDLLASEARLASFVAIAKGDVPVKHWYRLGRPLARVGLERALLSWTGTMFEYLMPTLLMGEHRGTLLDQSCHAAVDRQIAYGREHKVAWGISESAYNARDLQLNYQYGPFGIPGLGIRRGLGEDLVIAPYATALALAILPHAAVENLWRLSAEGLEGQYGFYESIDYTRSRVPEGERSQIVRTFMAHHQGMSLLAIANYLDDNKMVARFSSDPMIKATELLLQERVPRDVAAESPNEKEPHRVWLSRAHKREPWHAFSPAAEPAVHLLSNGNYSVMVSEAGGGYSRFRKLAVTRYREDPTSDRFGQFQYVRDVQSGRVWSSAYQPTLAAARAHDVCFSIDKAEFRRVEAGIETHTMVSVSMEDDAEVRAVTLTNRTRDVRELEVTSYAEIVLQAPAADAAHPAFGNLFVETEWLENEQAILATRRRRGNDDPSVWAIHVCAVEGEAVGEVQKETDRARFIGRGRSARNPLALAGTLSGTVGAVLDPVFSLRRRVRILPGQSARVVFVTAAADTRARAVELAGKYRDVAAAERASALAWTHAHAQLHYLDIDVNDAHLYLELAAHLLYATPSLRAPGDVLTKNERGQSGLWAYGISGDLPILLVRVDIDEHLNLFRQALRAHEFWRLRGFSVDLVILNEHPPSYSQSFHDTIMAVVGSGPGAVLIDQPGGIFVRRADLMPVEDQRLLMTAARAVLVGNRGPLAEQLAAAAKQEKRSPAGPSHVIKPAEGGTAAPPSIDLQLWNGLGGFSKNEYVMHLPEGQSPWAPWANVMANPRFGTLVTESGGGYDWAENAHENRLTEWSNDPVSDPLNTVFYIRDNDSGACFTPTARPMAGGGARTVRHGQGYSVFAAHAADLDAELTLFVPADHPLKVARLQITNTSANARALTVYPYVEWTLGVERDRDAPHVVTSIDEATGCLLAKSSMPGELGPRVAFVDSLPRPSSLSGDRAEFLGRNGDLSNPAALATSGLSNRVGAGLDPCAALEIRVALAAKETREVVVIIGQAADLGEARSLVERYRQAGAVERAFAESRAEWQRLLGAITVETPEKSRDRLVNHWLLYQVTSSRLWGRTGLYQSGGAYGFRDQLQDVAALVYGRPDLAREHILRAAARQFREGDVQHWWHPPAGRGVRTRFADDFLWIPYITTHYLDVTGDLAILDQIVPFIEARALEPHEHEAYLLPTVSDERAPLWEHCLRAVERALPVGEHGLPLMGCGDWNDGMNRVGIEGRGESVWMAWFLIDTLNRLQPICEKRGDEARARRYRDHANALKLAIESKAWDGDWYLRAFFDDGTPLGSKDKSECQIDSIAQSWALISGAGEAARTERALQSVDERLFDRDANLIKLLAPPFHEASEDPGYIKGYVPGVRENGGQYTHAALWVVWAHLIRGDGDRAAELLNALDPICRSARDPALYRVEPYVVAGDVAAAPPLTGRGGWTWYTGSASWMYRVIVEAQLGFRLRGDRLTIDPCIPHTWPGFVLTYRKGAASWRITVENPARVCRGVRSMSLDGKEAKEIVIDDDGREHQVVVTLG